MISAAVGLVHINLLPDYDLSSSTRFGQFRKFKKIGVGAWGHRPPHPPLRTKFLHGVRVLVRGYPRVRFDLPSSINFRDIGGL